MHTDLYPMPIEDIFHNMFHYDDDKVHFIESCESLKLTHLKKIKSIFPVLPPCSRVPQ